MLVELSLKYKKHSLNYIHYAYGSRMVKTYMTKLDKMTATHKFILISSMFNCINVTKFDDGSNAISYYYTQWN